VPNCCADCAFDLQGGNQSRIMDKGAEMRRAARHEDGDEGHKQTNWWSIMKKYKPVNLIDDKGFWPEKVAVADAIKEILALGECHRPLPVSDFGTYRGLKWRDENEDLVPYQSVDWYIYNAINEERMQVNTARLLESFSKEPWRDEKMLGDHYDLFVIDEDMFDPEDHGDGSPPADYSVGRAQTFVGAIISTHRIDHIWGMPYSYLKTEVMRQLCFMFGVPDRHRGGVVTEGSQAYCTNTCILRAAHVAPDDWQKLTEDRITHGPLCEPCRKELKEFFAMVAKEPD